MYKITITYTDKRKTEFTAIKKYVMYDNYVYFSLTDKISYYVPFINVLELRVEEI